MHHEDPEDRRGDPRPHRHEARRPSLSWRGWRATTLETVHLSVLDDTDVFYVHKIDSPPAGPRVLRDLRPRPRLLRRHGQGAARFPRTSRTCSASASACARTPRARFRRRWSCARSSRRCASRATP
jgi:hypothetical protein